VINLGTVLHYWYVKFMSIVMEPDCAENWSQFLTGHYWVVGIPLWDAIA